MGLHIHSGQSKAISFACVSLTTTRSSEDWQIKPLTCTPHIPELHCLLYKLAVHGFCQPQRVQNNSVEQYNRDVAFEGLACGCSIAAPPTLMEIRPSLHIHIYCCLLFCSFMFLFVGALEVHCNACTCCHQTVDDGTHGVGTSESSNSQEDEHEDQKQQYNGIYQHNDESCLGDTGSNHVLVNNLLLQQHQRGKCQQQVSQMRNMSLPAARCRNSLQTQHTKDI